MGAQDRNRQLIDWLFEVVEEMSSEDGALFLRFVTGCLREPLLGECVLFVRVDREDSVYVGGKIEEVCGD